MRVASIIALGIQAVAVAASPLVARGGFTYLELAIDGLSPSYKNIVPLHDCVPLSYIAPSLDEISFIKTNGACCQFYKNEACSGASLSTDIMQHFDTYKGWTTLNDAWAYKIRAAYCTSGPSGFPFKE